MAATSEAACRTTARPLAAPASEVAPTWPANRANWMDSVTPMGSATNTVGITAVPAMNAACRTNSAHWKRPITRSATKYRTVCTARTNCSPTVVSAAIRMVPHISRAAGTKCADPLGHLAADTD